MPRHATIAPDAPLAEGCHLQLVASSGRWRFLSLLGLLLGFALGRLVQTKAQTKQAQRSAPSAAAHVGGPEAAAATAALRPTAGSPTARAPTAVALCIGGLLELTIPQRGQSVADHVLRYA